MPSLVRPAIPWRWEITFDDDEEFAIDCYRIISRLRRDNSDLRHLIAGVAFANDLIFTPLQAADILAHLTRERLLTGQMPPLLERLRTPASGFALHFDGGELWDEGEIDKNWALIESSGDMPPAWSYPDALEPQGTQKIILPNEKEVEIARAEPVFVRWAGETPSDTFGGKPVLELDGEMVFAELAILRIFERAGWDAGLIATETDF